MLSRIATIAALAAGGALLSRQLKKSRNPRATSTVEATIDVNVPVSTAYNQWTQFEEFPRFMDSVREVRQLDDEHLHWRATVARKEVEWDAEITEQVPDRRIAWRSTSGFRNAGVVSFKELSDSTTRIKLRMEYEPQTSDEKLGDALGVVKLEARGNLKRFKELIETRGVETGAWRGTVTQH